MSVCERGLAVVDLGTGKFWFKEMGYTKCTVINHQSDQRTMERWSSYIKRPSEFVEPILQQRSNHLSR